MPFFMHFSNTLQNKYFVTIRLEVMDMYYGYQPAPPVGRWLMANSLEEIQSAPIPMDGAQTMFMLQNEPIFYVVSIANGQKMIQGYRFEVLTQANAPAPKLSIEDRMARLEGMIASMMEGKKDESNIPEPTADNTTAKPTV